MFSKIMKCVILVAGHGTLLESEIRRHGPRNLVGIPKSLLPGVGTKKILDSWWNCLNQKHIFTDVFLVTNADKYKVSNRIQVRIRLNQAGELFSHSPFSITKGGQPHMVFLCPILLTMVPLQFTIRLGP